MKFLQCALVCGSLAFVSGGLHAQECPTIADPIKRVECYDRAAAMKQGSATAAKADDSIQTAVRKSLKDPSSAQFGQQTIVDDEYACQAVNARNSYGGYGGERQAVVSRVADTWFIVGIQEMSHERCIELAKQIKDRLKK